MMNIFDLFKKKRETPLKLVCFDLDNTLCNTADGEAETEAYLIERIYEDMILLKEKTEATVSKKSSLRKSSKTVSKNISKDVLKTIPEKTILTLTFFLKTFNTIKNAHMHHDELPAHYSRKYWFTLLLKELNKECELKLTPYSIEQYAARYESRYWEYLTPQLKLYPETVTMLASLKALGLQTACLTDSDGEKGIKIRRIVYLGLDKQFDFIITSDDTKKNKPAKENWHYLLAHTQFHASECMMVGDHPEIDLLNAKKCGFITVWTKEQFHTASHFDYVDHEISHIKDVTRIVKKYV